MCQCWFILKYSSSDDVTKRVYSSLDCQPYLGTLSSCNHHHRQQQQQLASLSMLFLQHACKKNTAESPGWYNIQQRTEETERARTKGERLRRERDREYSTCEAIKAAVPDHVPTTCRISLRLGDERETRLTAGIPEGVAAAMWNHLYCLRRRMTHPSKTAITATAAF